MLVKEEMQIRVSVVIPAYHEEATIEQTPPYRSVT